MTEEAIETELTDEPVCPWCGNEDADWWELGDKIQDGNTVEVECDECGEPYDLEVVISYSFTSTKVTPRMRQERKIEELSQIERTWRRKYFSSMHPSTESMLTRLNHQVASMQAALDGATSG